MDKKYPAMLYVGGNRDQRHKVVKDAAQEEAAQAEGFYRIGDSDIPTKPSETVTTAPPVADPTPNDLPPAAAPKPRGRPPKAAK